MSFERLLNTHVGGRDVSAACKSVWLKGILTLNTLECYVRQPHKVLTDCGGVVLPRLHDEVALLAVRTQQRKPPEAGAMPPHLNMHQKHH